MSIESKHAYRFGYLNSEQWKSVRLEALVREKGRCQICGEESISNDAHHIWYPKSIYETTKDHLVILCRPCHSLLHALYPDRMSNDEGIGRAKWIEFRNAFNAWMLSKRPQVGPPEKTKQLRKAYDDLKEKHRLLHSDYQRVCHQLKKINIA